MDFPLQPSIIEVPSRIPELSLEKKRDPLIVSLYGGPGVGKSTVAALVFGDLKQAGINVEFVSEIAKGFTWEERWHTLGHQPYVISKQLRDYDRLYGKVDCIVTDTSSLLGLIYGSEQHTPEVTHAFRSWIVADWRARRTLNVFLQRNDEGDYQTAGRKESVGDALVLDGRIWQMLMSNNIPVMECPAYGSKDEIVEEVMRCLN
jgi:hypothetical protein